MPILRSSARFKVVVCGRRWGKTALGLMAVLDGHGLGRHKGAINGGKIWWVAPDYPTAIEIWRDLCRACRGAWTHKEEVQRRIDLPGGGSVTVKSAHDPGSLVGVGLDGVVMDEAGKVDGRAWSESLRPTLSDRGGWAIFIGTPKGANWFKDLFDHAGMTPDWERWQRPTSDNPLIPAEELKAAEADAPRHYRQEYKAEFTSPEGAEWPPEYFGPHMWPDYWPNHFVASALALDPAQGKGEREKGCFAAFVFTGVDHQGIIWVDAWLSQTWDAAGLVSEGFRLCRDLRPTAFVLETNGGQEFLGELFLAESRQRALPLPLHGIHNSIDKTVRIRSGVGPFLAQKRLRLRAGSPGAKLLGQQLQDFPVGDYVDGPDSLQMALAMLDSVLSGGTGGPKALRA